MNERDHSGGGGLTGATGDLTFEENDRPLVTGEAREVSDPDRHADVTIAEGAGSSAGGSEPQIGGDQLADREEHL